MRLLDALVKNLMEELNCDTVFTIPLFGGIPIYESVVEEFKKLMEGTLEVVLVDIDQEPALTDFYTVESTPTFILFRKGQQLWRQSGELPLERLERAVKGFKS